MLASRAGLILHGPVHDHDHDRLSAPAHVDTWRRRVTLLTRPGTKNRAEI
jgi:hypothetical protein